ncbi:Protein CBG23514, partial [Caenorhabditis briggsae]
KGPEKELWLEPGARSLGSGAGALELELWSSGAGAGALELELWSWSSGAGALELELWSWSLVAGALWLEPELEQDEMLVEDLL